MYTSVKMIVCIFVLSFPYFPNISQHFQSILIIVIFSFHSRSRSRPFPGIIASDSRSRISGTFFFIPFPFPNFGNAFFHSLPVPEFWEWIFSFPSRSRILGMEFSIPFPFPNFGNGIFYSRSRSRTLKSHSRSPLRQGVISGSESEMTFLLQSNYPNSQWWSVSPFQANCCC